MLDTNISYDNIYQILLENIEQYTPFKNYKEAALFVKNYLKGVGITNIPAISTKKFKHLMQNIEEEIYLYDDFAYWNEVNKVIKLLPNSKDLEYIDFLNAITELGYFETDLENIIYKKLKELGYKFRNVF